MTPGADLPKDVMLELTQPLGAAQAGFEELGPISPELALVDHVLAERARKLLPEPREPRRPPAAAVRPRRPVAREPEMASPAPARSRPRRLRRAVLLAAIVFITGAASGGFVERKHRTSSEVTFAAHAEAQSTTTTTDASERPLVGMSSGMRSAPSSRPVARSDHRPAVAPRPRELRRAAPVIWAENVLGVTAGSDSKGVELVWQPPRSSDHVVVLRAQGTRKRSVVVYRGSATSYRDASALSCSVYRYTIVNYDTRGHRSTGIPTSVVTEGCA